MKRESEWCFRLYCLLAHVICTFQTNLGQPYVRLVSKFKNTRKEVMLSWHLLRESIYLKCHKWCIQRDIMFSKNFWCAVAITSEKKTSKSSNMTNFTLQMQFLIINRRTNDSKCVFMLHCALMSRWFCLRNWLQIILTFFLNTDIDAVFLAFCGGCH